jgi:hypothetical protein
MSWEATEARKIELSRQIRAWFKLTREYFHALASGEKKFG